MKMNTALHNVSFVWNFIFYSSFKHFPYKTEDYAQSNSAKIAVRWLLLILNIFAILLVGTQIAPSILQGLVAALTADAITLSISRCQN